MLLFVQQNWIFVDESKYSERRGSYTDIGSGFRHCLALNLQCIPWTAADGRV